MTLNLRSASTSVATTKGSALTHAEMDANWLHALQSSNSEFLQSGTGAISRTVQDDLRDRVSVFRFFTAAQISDVRNRLFTVDVRAALQQAIDTSVADQFELWLPYGRYKTADSLVIPNSLAMQSASPWLTVIEATGTTYPVFINKSSQAADCKNVMLKGFEVKNGTRSFLLTISGNQSLWVWEDLRLTEASLSGIETTGNFLLNSLKRVAFHNTLIGFRNTGGAVNANDFDTCRFEELNDSALRIGAGEANNFRTCRFEARSGATGETVIILSGSKATTFDTCYFEDTFRQILTETSSSGSTTFRACRFSGQETGQSELFTSDGAVVFDCNDFAVGSNGSAQMDVRGVNTNLATIGANTWTPVITFATPGDLSVAYSQQIGKYTREGNRVTAHFRIVTSTFTHTTASGNLSITGLPFTSGTLTNFFQGGALMWEGITKATYTDINPVVASNSAVISLVASGSGVAGSVVGVPDMPTGGTVALTGTVSYLLP